MSKRIMIYPLDGDEHHCKVGWADGRKHIKAAKSAGFVKVSRKTFNDIILPRWRKLGRDVNGVPASRFTYYTIPDLPEDIGGQLDNKLGEED